MRKATQCQRILDFIDRNGSITPVEAMSQIGCMRLAARIADLEKVGHSFVHEMVTKKSEYGPVRFMKYRRA